MFKSLITPSSFSWHIRFQGEKMKKKLLLHKATILMMISFSTFSTMHINLLETKKWGVKIQNEKQKLVAAKWGGVKMRRVESDDKISQNARSQSKHPFGRFWKKDVTSSKNFSGTLLFFLNYILRTGTNLFVKYNYLIINFGIC